MTVKTFDVYIAIPYTHECANVRMARYHKSTEYLAHLSKKDLVAFSPITHSHPMADYDMPTTWDFWAKIDLRILANCEEIHVLTMDGWDVSTGVTAELRAARENGTIVRFIDPETLEELR